MRFLTPILAVGCAIAVTVAGFLVPAQQVSPGAATVEDRGRVSVVCPSFRSASATVTALAAGGADQLTTATLADPAATTSVAGLGTVRNSAQPVLVSAPRAATFGATTSSTAESGADRGLSLVACDLPRSDAWFPGVSTSDTGQAVLVLTNLDSTEAAVDVAVIGPEGRVAAPGSRGIVVAPHTHRLVSLGPIASLPEQVTLHVTTSQGRVAAVVRQRLWRDDLAVGTEWLPAAAAPANTVVIPDIPGGKGWRDLVVANPGTRTASVRLDVLGVEGRTAIPGFETLDIPAGTTRMVPLANGLAEAAVGLKLTSEQRITATMISGTGTDPVTADLVVQTSVAPVGADSVWPVPASAKARAVLAMSNGSEVEARATVVVTDAAGKELLRRDVSVAPQASLSVELPKAANPIVSVRTDAPALHAGVTVSEKLGKVLGVGSFVFRPTQAQLGFPEIRQDPRVGQ